MSVRGAAQRERILDAAADVLADKGYVGMTLKEIGDRVGAYSGSFYHYFVDRDDLVKQVLVRGVTELNATVRKAVDDQAPDASARHILTTAIIAYAEGVLASPSYTMAFQRNVGHVPEDIEVTVRPSRRALNRLFADLFERARVSGDIDSDIDLNAARMLIIGSGGWTTVWYSPSRSSTPRQLGELLARMVFTGLGPTKPSTRRPRR